MSGRSDAPFRFADLWRWDGTVGRRLYALLGVALAAAKYTLDVAVNFLAFERVWTPLDYFDVPGTGVITALERGEMYYCAVLVLLALPFIWVGAALTARRLRDAGRPAGWAVLFFVPLVNLVFFGLLTALPSREAARPELQPGRSWAAAVGRLIPRGKLGSAAAALVITLPAFLAGTWLSVQVLASYGWGLFVGIPFALGVVAAMLHGYHAERSRRACIGVANLALALLCGALLLIAIEGIVCLVMAAPLAFLVATLGGMLGHVLQRRPAGYGPADAPRVAGVAVLSVALLLGAEGAAGPSDVPPAPVRTSVVVDAPPEAVWPHVVSFPPLPPPEGLPFRAGVAYPTHARIEGRGPGAVRHCVFSTGAFVEPITAWEPPRRLAFDVARQPPPLREWTPLGNPPEPPHLSYLRSQRGEFRLEPLPGGRTRLIGTTWYRHRIGPAAYWRLWSDALIVRIHRRVLRHVKRLAEAAKDAPAKELSRPPMP